MGTPLEVPAFDEPKTPPAPLDVEAQPATGKAQSQEATTSELPGGTVIYFQAYSVQKFLPVALAAILVIWSFCWMYLGVTWNPTVRPRGCSTDRAHMRHACTQMHGHMHARITPPFLIQIPPVHAVSHAAFCKYCAPMLGHHGRIRYTRA